MACPDEIQDCELMKLGDGQLLRKLLRLDGDCLRLAVEALVNVSATVSTPVESAVTTNEITAATSVAMLAAYQAWKTANPTRKVVREIAFTNPDGLPSIYISHTA